MSLLRPAPTETELWDVERFRLPAELLGAAVPRPRLPRHRPGEPFIRGPIPFDWISTACRLPGAGLAVATALRFHHDRFRGRRRWGIHDLAAGLHASPPTVRRGLHAAEMVGLLVVEREPGCKLAVRIGKLPPRANGAETETRPLYGPIPWAWWLAAMRLPHPALRTATACWLTAGWERSGEFVFATGAWAELGLSRLAARRGLATLALGGLVALGAERAVVRLSEVPTRPTTGANGKA